MAEKQNPTNPPAARELDKFELFFIANSKKILIGSGILVVLIAIGVSIWEYAKGSDARSAEAFSKAVTEEEIRTTLKQYPSGPAAFEARFRLAKMFQTKADKEGFKKASALYAQAAADEKIDDYLRARALMEMASSLELAGEPDSAATAFQSISGELRYPEEIRLEAAYQAGRIQASRKKYTEARALFRRASVKNVRSQAAAFWSDLASKAMDRLPVQKKIQKVPPAKPAGQPSPVKK